MKKLLFASSAIALSLFLAGCQKKTTEATNTPSDDTTMTANSEAGMSDKMKQWADAVKLGGGLKCTLTDTATGKTANYSLKGKKFHAKGTALSTTEKMQNGEMVSDSEYMYIWDTDTKEGMKMKLPTEEELKAGETQAQEALKNMPQSPDFSDPEGIEKLEQDGTKLDCNPAVISDSEFNVPSDIKFQDFSEMMKKAMDSFKSGMTEEQQKQIEDAMKKAGQ